MPSLAKSLFASSAIALGLLAVLGGAQAQQSNPSEVAAAVRKIEIVSGAQTAANPVVANPLTVAQQAQAQQTEAQPSETDEPAPTETAATAPATTASAPTQAVPQTILSDEQKQLNRQRYIERYESQQYAKPRYKERYAEPRYKERHVERYYVEPRYSAPRDTYKHRPHHGHYEYRGSRY